MIYKISKIVEKKAQTKTSFLEQAAIVTHYIKHINVEYRERAETILNDWAKCLGIDVLELRQLLLNDIKSKAYYKDNVDAKFTFIDLFAGIGGFRLAMQEFGGECVFSSEFNPKAQTTYYHNYGEVPYGDITLKETKDMIPLSFDILCGGFPCQAFSIAGYRKGFEDTRGTLFFDIAEIIKKHSPKAVYLENVRNLEGHDSGRTFDVIRNTLIELGYSVYHKVLDASKYANIPQHRERIIIVAFNNEKVEGHERFVFPKQVLLDKTIYNCIHPGKKEERYYYRESQKYYPQLIKDMINPNTIYQWRRVYCRGNKSNLCPTLTANMGGGGHNVPLILTEEGIRKLTPKECLNFMGYPENFDFPTNISESAKYMQAGNSVVVPMMTRVAEQIVKVLLN